MHARPRRSALGGREGGREEGREGVRGGAMVTFRHFSPFPLPLPTYLPPSLIPCCLSPPLFVPLSCPFLLPTPPSLPLSLPPSLPLWAPANRTSLAAAAGVSCRCIQWRTHLGGMGREGGREGKMKGGEEKAMAEAER